MVCSPVFWGVLWRAQMPSTRGIILSSVLTKVLAGVTILYWVFIAGINLPSPWLLPAAVGVQVLFAFAEAVYCLPSRTGGPNRRVA